MEHLILTALHKTWIFDLDGTLVVHNGYLQGEDRLLPGVKEFFSDVVKEDDYVLILTARKKEYEQKTVSFLNREGIRYSKILFEIPHGERILLNDGKPSGHTMAYAVDLVRDQGIKLSVEIDRNL